MPRQKASATAVKTSTLTIGPKVKAQPAQLTREQQLEAENAQLRAQLEAKPAARRATAEYPEPKTPREVAIEVAQNADMMRDLHNLMVQRIPGSQTADKPYGKGVLYTLKSGQQAYKMRSDFGTSEDEQKEARNHYIKLGKLAAQVYGNPLHYQDAEALTDDQIDRILRPALDFLAEFGLVNWEATN